MACCGLPHVGDEDDEYEDEDQDGNANGDEDQDQDGEEDEEEDGDGDEVPTFLSNELRYINWVGYPGISFPDNFHATKLVVLNMQSSLQKVLWNSDMDLPSLKVLELIDMENLVSTPDFNRLPCLQKFTISFCRKLEKIHRSLGNHTSLQYVCVCNCKKLREFPAKMQMRKLQTLEIMWCPNISTFPDIQANMESLVNLSLYGSKIEVLPSSIGKRCTNLTSLNLSESRNLKSIEFNMDALRVLKEFKCYGQQNLSKIMWFHQFPCSLQKLSLKYCGIEDENFISCILELSNLEELHLNGNEFSRLDSRLSQLTLLKILNLGDCENLVRLPELPSSLAILKLKGCRSLVGLPELPSSLAILKTPWCESLTETLTNSKWLREVRVSPHSIINHGDKVLKYVRQPGKVMENGTTFFTLEGGRELVKRFPRGVIHKGNQCRLQLPHNWRNECCGFLMFVFRNQPLLEITLTKIKVEGGQSGSMKSEDEMAWNESGDLLLRGSPNFMSWVGYISFDLLRDTPWWHQTCNHLIFSTMYGLFTSSNWLGIELVGKTSEGGSGSTNVSNYTSDLKIEHEWDLLRIDFGY